MRSGFQAPFRSFLQVSRAPKNLKCLLLVSKNLLQAFNSAPTFWQDTDPFRQWPELFDFLLKHQHEVCQLVGQQAADGLVPPSGIRPKDSRNPMMGQMGDAPLFAMLCTEHETTKLREKYAALHLQVLYAHWLKLMEFLKDHPGHSGEIREGRRRTKDEERHIKMCNTAAITVRMLQVKNFDYWMSELGTQCHPTRFAEELEGNRPSEKDLRIFHRRLLNYCRTGYKPSSRDSGGERHRLIGRYLYMVDYTGHRFGLATEGRGSDDGGSSNSQEHIIHGRAHGKAGRSLTNKEILNLGLDPLEIADGNPIVLTAVPEAASRQEAVEIAQARTRAFEIERRLFPWNSQAIRIEEFQKDLLPILAKISNGLTVSERELAAAVAVAIAAETGRSLEELLKLEIDNDPTSAFAYKPPDSEGGCGQWNWDSVGPHYESKLNIPDGFEVDRELYMSFSASEIVTKLIKRYTTARPPKGRKLFPFQVRGFRKVVKAWLSQHDGDGRYTLGRITNLKWGLLHSLTGGELASVCLVLGLFHPIAQVELFYAVLETTEAASLFADSLDRLWATKSQAPIAAPPHSVPHQGLFVGCRAFPKISKVRETVEWLSEGSRAFFALKLPSFDPTRDSELLNRAVMYLVWHQFYCFGTRAICDAYQTMDQISEGTGIGILSDKDFATGYKTRIILAPERLRRHMSALERRLAELHVRFPNWSRHDMPPVWFLDAGHQPVEIEPTTIAEVVKERFPFPVNTPRKVMRYLLRKAAMSHAHAEAFMGHWWQGREPFSPFSSFNFRAFVEDLNGLIPSCVMDLGFNRVPGVRAK
jgi:hypothetical protein